MVTERWFRSSLYHKLYLMPRDVLGMTDEWVRSWVLRRFDNAIPTLHSYNSFGRKDLDRGTCECVRRVHSFKKNILLEILNVFLFPRLQ